MITVVRNDCFGDGNPPTMSFEGRETPLGFLEREKMLSENRTGVAMNE